MKFNAHPELEDRHAFLSASSYHWLNYSEEKLAEVYKAKMAAMRGTEIHDFARQCIELGQKLPRTKQTLCMYVNDAIGFHMQPEQKLKYSENCFGTADAIKFEKNLLRIHDLKTGVTPASFKQLEVYAALFCLEYQVVPENITFELRLYQNDDILTEIPTSEVIRATMDKIISSDKLIERIRIGDS